MRIFDPGFLFPDYAVPEKLGSLAMEIFGRIASSDKPVKKLYSAEAAADYSKAIGRDVRVDEIQPILNALVAENLVMRLGHGVYALSDPYVGEIWKDIQRLTDAEELARDR
ncbi:hypothetical protein [Pseudomonas sp. DC3000-4b1]|uniref:hypothetical protein n=1 Tax=unclassified Pseudomonas TaxID=196821 RepID=UPI003CE6CE24